MNNKFKYLFLSGIICLAMNLLKHNTLVISVFNSIILIGYLLLFIKSVSFNKFFLLPFLAIIPIFSYNHNYISVYIIEAIVLITWYMFFKTTGRKKILTAFILSALFIYFVLLSNHIVKIPFKFEKELLIYPQNSYQLEIDRQQKESMYLPYRLRSIVFSETTSYGYVFVGNIFSFLSLENLYRTILLVNVIFVFIGIYYINNLEKKYKFLIYISLLMSLLIVGLLKTPDSMRPLSSLRGIFILLTLNGLNNKYGLKIYLVLFLLSLLINIA